MTVNALGRRAAGLAALSTLAVLLATVDTRAYGLIPDGKEMLSASAAVARFFEIGISRDFVNAPRRPGGDAVSRYGMGLSFVEAVPGVLARAAGARRTAPLFVLVPVLCLAGCAWTSARALAALGVPGAPAALFGGALVLATPLWGYAASDYGEPLQALCVSCCVLAVAELRAAPASRLWQVALGLAAGFAILTKTLLVLVVAPLVLCALVGRRREEKSGESAAPTAPQGRAADEHVRRRDARHAARAERRAARFRTRQEGPAARRVAPPWPLLLSFTGILLLWSLFELSRFGRLFGGYAGETFTYPFFTGLLRLTLLPNKGLLWYAPVVLLAIPGFAALYRRDARLALALGASALVLVLASSAWWAWDGQAGWGPRLLLPGLPPALVLAGVAFAAGARGLKAAAFLTIAAGVGVNALGALVPFPAVYALSAQVAPQPISEARAAGTQYEIAPGADGILRATAPHHLSLTPAWSPIRVHALVLAGRLRGGWSGSLPALDPPFAPQMPPGPAPALRLALSPLQLGWGRELVESEKAEGAGASGASAWADPYRDALRDQLVRAIDMKDYARARELGGANDPRTVALTAEAIRLGGTNGGTGASGPDSRAPASLAYLSEKSSSSSSFSCHPWILFVRAMAGPPGDFSCLPESQREGFARGVEIARQRGWALTEWNRAATTGRP